jgi:hypothetical protein
MGGTINAAPRGGESLTVSSAGGQIFNGVVGGTRALSTMTTSGGTTELNNDVGAGLSTVGVVGQLEIEGALEFDDILKSVQIVEAGSVLVKGSVTVNTLGGVIVSGYPQDYDILPIKSTAGNILLELPLGELLSPENETILGEIIKGTYVAPRPEIPNVVLASSICDAPTNLPAGNYVIRSCSPLVDASFAKKAH